MATAAGTGTETDGAAEATIDVEVASETSGIPDVADIEAWVRRAVDASGECRDRRIEVAVRVVGTDEIRFLNSTYRQRDNATNVLSFPAGTIESLPATVGVHLGDIVICAEVVAREAAAQDRPLPNHWAHMLVHGTLHLLGYDHDTGPDAEAMERLEARVLERHGITNPYAAE